MFCLIQRVGSAVITIFGCLALLFVCSEAFGRDELSNNNPSVAAAATTDDPLIPWPTSYGVQQTGSLNAMFACNATFGLGWVDCNINISGWPYASFETPPGSGKDYLFGGAIWVGGIVGSDTLVTTGTDGWSCYGREFRPPHYPTGSITRSLSKADYSMRAYFLDTADYIDYWPWQGIQHTPLNLAVSNKSHIWRTSEYQDIVVYDITVTNIGNDIIQKAYLGLYMDADVFDWSVSADGHTDDLVGSIRNEGIAYVLDNDGDPEGGMFTETRSVQKLFAVKLLASSHPLADTNFNWWVCNAVAANDFGPRLKEDPFRDFGTGGTGTPEGDCNKYYILSHKEWDYDQVFTASIQDDNPLWCYPPQTIDDNLTDGTDIRFLLSYGPVDLEADSSIRLVFANFTADYVHTDPTNLTNLPGDPVKYLSNLNFSGVLSNAIAAYNLADTILDPLLPPTGLDTLYHCCDSTVIEWDPWVFDDVVGYEIFCSNIPLDGFPYPGVVPPWISEGTPVPFASTEVYNRFTLSGLNCDSVYSVRVAHRTSSQTGAVSDPLIMVQRDRTPPGIESNTVFYYDDTSPVLSWTAPAGFPVDHYRVYRFVDSLSFAAKYHAFYDIGEAKDLIAPKDSFEVNDTTYYYYAMDVYATTGDDLTLYSESGPLDGAYYVITAVDAAGFESEFSPRIRTFRLEHQTKDILLVTYTYMPTLGYKDTVEAFYRDVLQPYNFDIYWVMDTLSAYYCSAEDSECIDWRIFTQYKMVICDDDRRDRLLTPYVENLTNRFTLYLLSGGKLAYFGSLYYFVNPTYSGYAGWYPQTDDFISRFMGIDSIFYYGMTYYYTLLGTISPDTSFGFTRAESVHPSLGDIAYDVIRNTFTDYAMTRWLVETPPEVAAFSTDDQGRVVQVYRSLYPETSMIEGQPVGIHTLTDEAETYLFGFHLWYMEREPARSLVDAIFNGLPTHAEEQAQSPALPGKFILRQNYPNPFNPSTIVVFELPHESRVSLEIFNVLGQRVKMLVDDRSYAPGTYRVEWSGDDDNGNRVASGIYLYRLKADDHIASKKMLLVK